MRVVYVPEDNQEHGKRVYWLMGGTEPVEFIPVPDLHVHWIDNSMATQVYLREKGLESLMRPLETEASPCG